MSALFLHLLPRKLLLKIRNRVNGDTTVINLQILLTFIGVCLHQDEEWDKIICGEVLIKGKFNTFEREKRKITISLSQYNGIKYIVGYIVYQMWQFIVK